MYWFLSDLHKEEAKNHGGSANGQVKNMQPLKVPPCRNWEWRISLFYKRFMYKGLH